MKSFYTLLAFLVGLIDAQAKLNVVASTPDFAAIAREIGGNQIEVFTLAKPTEDPHFVDAKPSFVAKLSRADVLIEGGADLEIGWLAPLVDGARNPKIRAGQPGRISCNEGVNLLEIPATLDRSKGDIHAAGNPHYLLDPANAQIVARHIANAFCRLDKSGCDEFKANLEKFEKRLSSSIEDWQKQLAPHAEQQFVTYHNSLPYFAKRFGLKSDLFLEPKPGIPPSPAHLASVISKMKANDVRLVLIQPYQNRKTAESVARHTGAKVLDFPIFPQSAEQSYFDWMNQLVQSTARALSATK